MKIIKDFKSFKTNKYRLFNLFSSLNKIPSDFKYLLISQSPSNWDEDLIHNELGGIGMINYVKKINSPVTSHAQTNDFIVNFKSNDNHIKMKNIENLINKGGDKIHVQISKSLKVSSPLETKEHNYLQFICSKDGSDIQEANSIKELLIHEEINKSIKVKYLNSNFSMAYIWYKNKSLSNTFENKIKEEKNLYSCNVNKHALDEQKGTTDIKNTTNDLLKLKIIKKRKMIFSLDQKLSKRIDIKADLKNEENRLQYVLKEKENLRDMNDHVIIGNSGILIYDKL